MYEELGAKTALEVTILDHPSQSLQITYFPAMLQWPNDSYYVADTCSCNLNWKKNQNFPVF